MRRPGLVWRLLLIALGAFVGLGPSSWPWQKDLNMTWASPAPAEQAGGPFVGVWAHPGEGGRLDDLGVGWARVSVFWRDVETSDGVYAWGALDSAMVDAAGGGHRRVLATISHNPAWAAANPCRLASDAERARLADFTTALVNRYKGTIPNGSYAGRLVGVKHWAFYNEPDNTSQAAELGGCWATLQGGAPTQAGRDAYARMIEAVGPAVHAADPAGQALMGAVASGNYTDVCAPQCTFDREFSSGVLAALKARGTAGRLDGLMVNYYSSQGLAFGFDAYGVDLIGRITRMRQDMREAGLAEAELKPILVQEGSYTGETYYDASSSTSDPADRYNQVQRNYVPKALARAAYVGVTAYYWFWLRDQSIGPGSDTAYGLSDLGGIPKPSYQALRYFSRLIDRADRLVGRLDGTPDTLEGYEFTTTDGRRVQLVWTAPDDPPVPYSPPAGRITAVTDSTGGAAPFADNVVSVGAEPRFVFYIPEPATATPSPTATGTATGTATPTGTATATPTATATSTATPSPTATPTPTPTATLTPTPPATATPTPTATPTSAPTMSPTLVPVPALAAAATASLTQTPVVILARAETPTPTPILPPPETPTPVPTATELASPPAPPAPIPTATALPTLTPTAPPPALAAAPCSPRPAVLVSAVPDGLGRIRVTITAGTNPGTPSNSLRELRIGPTRNALVDLDSLTGSTGNVLVALPPEAQQTVFLVRRVSPGPVYVPLVVVDGCGDWPTFVGGGPDAF